MNKSPLTVVVAGAVQSTAETLRSLIRCGVRPVGVLGLDVSVSKNVSGFVDLCELGASLGVEILSFKNINDDEVEVQLNSWNPDILFVVGLSQLVTNRIMEIPSKFCIGFHPTLLPLGRGRAPLAWLTLGVVSGAASFFLLEETADSGAIISQIPFEVPHDATASEVEALILVGIREAIPKVSAMILSGEFEYAEQNHSDASWLGRRTPMDGEISWSSSSLDVARLVRASSSPHPGAFTFETTSKIRIWECKVSNRPHSGVVGRILEVAGATFLVQCGTGLLEVSKWTSNGWSPKVGQMLGYYPDASIYSLNKKVKRLEARLHELESRLKV